LSTIFSANRRPDDVGPNRRGHRRQRPTVGSRQRRRGRAVRRRPRGQLPHVTDLQLHRDFASVGGIRRGVRHTTRRQLPVSTAAVALVIQHQYCYYRHATNVLGMLLIFFIRVTCGRGAVNSWNSYTLLLIRFPSLKRIAEKFLKIDIRL